MVWKPDPVRVHVVCASKRPLGARSTKSSPGDTVIGDATPLSQVIKALPVTEPEMEALPFWLLLSVVPGSYRNMSELGRTLLPVV